LCKFPFSFLNLSTLRKFVIIVILFGVLGSVTPLSAKTVSPQQEQENLEVRPDQAQELPIDKESEKSEDFYTETDELSSPERSEEDTTLNTVSKYNYLFYFIYKYKYEQRGTHEDL
jgi:hypothetical protein